MSARFPFLFVFVVVAADPLSFCLSLSPIVGSSPRSGWTTPTGCGWWRARGPPTWCRPSPTAAGKYSLSPPSPPFLAQIPDWTPPISRTAALSSSKTTPSRRADSRGGRSSPWRSPRTMGRPGTPCAPWKPQRETWSSLTPPSSSQQTAAFTSRTPGRGTTYATSSSTQQSSPCNLIKQSVSFIKCTSLHVSITLR